MRGSDHAHHHQTDTKPVEADSQTGTIRRVPGVPHETLQNRDVLEEPIGTYLRRVSGGTPGTRRIPN